MNQILQDLIHLISNNGNRHLSPSPPPHLFSIGQPTQARSPLSSSFESIEVALTQPAMGLVKTDLLAGLFWEPHQTRCHSYVFTMV